MEQDFYNRVGNDRIKSRQIDELIGLARGLCADGALNLSEVQFLEKWLAANLAINEQTLLHTLWQRISGILHDGCVDHDEQVELFELLASLGGDAIELGEALKPTTLPYCEPAPSLWFEGANYCFTGTFSFGQRKACERAVEQKGASVGAITRKTDFLVIGAYATESWKHSSMGNKILKACEMRSKGLPIAIVSEAHWLSFL